MTIRPLRPLILPLVLLIVIALIAALLPGFKQVDDVFIQLVQAAPRSWEQAIFIITKIGDVPNLLLIAVIISLWELHQQNYVRALAMMGSLLSLPAFYAIKEIVQRARPVSEFIAQNELHGFSFPSGHSTGTMAIYGMIALLAYSHLKGITRYVIVGVCALIIIAVSFTRVYLGVHFPTDIFAGWLLGFVVISLLRSLSLYLAKRKPVPDSIAVDDTTEAPESIKN